jgi:hypothetical protein
MSSQCGMPNKTRFRPWGLGTVGRWSNRGASLRARWRRDLREPVLAVIRANPDFSNVVIARTLIATCRRTVENCVSGIRNRLD